MTARAELTQLQGTSILEAAGRAAGAAFGVLRHNPVELLHANAELEALLARAGIIGATARAAWLLASTHPGDGYEVHSTELPGGLSLVHARLAPAHRLEQLIDRLARRHGLSESEHRELFHLARGLAIKDSARELGISPETVRVRRKRVYRKMECRGHEALLARLCQEALFSGAPFEELSRTG